MKQSILIFIFLYYSLCGHSQTPDHNWVFGFFGQINFDGGVPNDAGGGPLDVDESSGSISNNAGELLFSTNGIVVRDRNGDIMPNGTGLKGHWSSSQNVVIVPFPGDTEERFYYIFTVGAQLGIWNGSGDGLEYVVVDMNENGGLGDVVQASIPLVANCAEKIHATYHTNNSDVWVVVHEMDSDAFFSVKVTCEGIEEPIESNTGSVYVTDPDAVGAVGYMKISHNGPYIASCFNTINPDGTLNENFLEIGTFNHETGEVIISETIMKPSEGFGSQSYGLEFSPDNSKLYWSIIGNPARILQFDMDAPDIEDSEVLIHTGNPQAAGMVLGPDGIIYLAHSGGPSFLSQIANPNAPGADIDIEIALTITNQSKLGLPNNWMYPYPANEVIADTETSNMGICPGESVTLESNVEGNSYLWDTGQTTPSISVNQAGTYSLLIESACNTYERIFEVASHPLPSFTTPDSPEICSGESIQLSILSNGLVTWFNGQEGNQITVDRGGSYAFSVSNEYCSTVGAVQVIENRRPQFNIPEFIEKCANRNTIIFPEAQGVYDYFLDGTPANPPLQIEKAGFYNLTAENDCGTEMKTVQIDNVDCSCEMYVPNAFTPDGDGLNDLLKPVLNCEALSYQFEVFDRWGQQVFHSTQAGEGWDGSLNGNGYYLPNDIYAFRLIWEAQKLGEKTFDQVSGHIQLIR